MTARDLSPFLRRLNDHCARALAEAASLCETRAHREIEIEHWLIKLLELGDGDLVAIARRYELEMDGIWNGLLKSIDRLPRELRGKPGLSHRLGQILEAAWLRASFEGNQPSIRSAHLLAVLADSPHLLRAPDAWQLLSVSAVQIERLMPELKRLSIEGQKEASMDSAAGSGATHTNADEPSIVVPKQATSDALQRFTIDITQKARDGKIDPVFGREVEIRQMVDILARRRKNNPILVGEPGVGKTALVEGLALKIIEGDVPTAIRNVSVLTLDLGLLQAGAGVKGEFEQRLKNVIEAVQQSSTPILLFIDEAHTLIGAGNTAGGADAANLLKPALARGELRTIAATTWSEYKQYFERDAALERRFQRVLVDEPDDAKASLMLRGLKGRYAQHHGVHILDAAITAAVTLSRRFLTGRQLPDKAVDLLDTAGARVRMSIDTLPEALMEINAELAALAMEQQAIEQDLLLLPNIGSTRLSDIEKRREELAVEQQKLEQQYEQEKRLTQLIIEARKEIADVTRLAQLQEELSQIQGNAPLLSLDVDARTVATVIADWTGVPLSSLLKDEQTDLLQLENHLATRVVGQDAALIDMAQRLRAAKTGLTAENGPLGVFLLVGPSGVGKTETALSLADTLFGGEKSLITINMSEYQEAHTVSQLKGSPPGYVGYGQGGILTEAVRKRPYSVVLLDEVEKAHRDVINLFYQVFDRGFMRDGEGREIDFRNSVILMTANLGSDHLMQLLDDQPQATHGEMHELLRPILRDHFQPALLARFQTLIYRPLDAEALRKIVEMKLAQVAKRLNKHYGLQCTFGESLYDTLVAACLLPDTGARNIDSLLNQQILPVLSQQLLSHIAAKQKPSTLQLSWDEEEGIVLAFDEPIEGVQQ